MSDKIKTAQERYWDRNREKWNEYEKERAKQKYQNDAEYRERKRIESLNYYHKLKDEGKLESLQKYKDTFRKNIPSITNNIIDNSINLLMKKTKIGF